MRGPESGLAALPRFREIAAVRESTPFATLRKGFWAHWLRPEIAVPESSSMYRGGSS